MTDPKEILRRVRTIDEEIAVLEKERERIREQETYINSIDYSAVIVKHSAKRGSVEDIGIKLADMDGKILGKINQLIAAKQRAEKLIDSLDDERYRNVLREYYILGNTWEQVAVDLNYSFRWTMTLHGRALNALRKRKHSSSHYPAV